MTKEEIIELCDSNEPEYMTNIDGSKIWKSKGLIRHRTDGPAIEKKNGAKIYIQYGEFHRDGAAAIVWKDGSEVYFKEGKLHNDSGPAFIEEDGTKKYYLDGEEVNEKDVMGEKEVGDTPVI